MAYITGGTIQMIDYNYLTWGGNTTNTYSGTINNLAMVWGTGIGYKGYGQNVAAISATTASSIVTATQWAGLVYTLNKTLAHQGITQLASGSNVGITAGANYPAIKSSDISIFLISLPPIKLQNQFAERVKAIEEQKSIAQASALKSEELFNSLLQKAFNGDLV